MNRIVDPVGILYTKDCKYFREGNQPANIKFDGTISRYKNGPAVIDFQGIVVWYLKDKFSRPLPRPVSFNPIMRRVNWKVVVEKIKTVYWE